MKTITTLHVPMEQTVRQKLMAEAKRLGFDSLQAYIRVWAKAEADGRRINFDDRNEPTPGVAARLRKIAEAGRQEQQTGKTR